LNVTRQIAELSTGTKVEDAVRFVGAFAVFVDPEGTD
jgi:hypothetical protein